MIAVSKRSAAILFVAAGLSIVSLGLCVMRAAQAQGISASHKLAHNLREFQRQANLQVPEMAPRESDQAQTSEPARLEAAEPAAPASGPEAARDNRPFRRLLLRPKTTSSPSNGDDLLS
jgi:short-subunit dehydrogenase involved in D-alanine esterification of teichoic acids